MATLDHSEIKESVREYYGERARNADSCCTPSSESSGDGTSSDCCSPEESRLYSADELQVLPEAAVNGSLGCGNPTAIASLRPGETVLDLGSGGGIDVFLSARQVGPQGFVYGVDMTDDMLALARRNAEKGGFTNVEFRKGHIEQIPLPNQSVDVIISNCVINLSPDKGQTLGEAFRVLRPGGRLVVSDIVIDGSLDDLPVTETQIRTALNWAGCIAGALTIEQYRTFLTQAGFAEIDVEIRHRYSLQDLGQELDSLELKLEAAVVQDLVNRFTSCAVTATRPV